jgi:hypothetical protein
LPASKYQHKCTDDAQYSNYQLLYYFHAASLLC